MNPIYISYVYIQLLTPLTTPHHLSNIPLPPPLLGTHQQIAKEDQD